MSQPVAPAPSVVNATGNLPISRPAKQKIKEALVALSLANLCFINAWFASLYDADLGYFNRLRVTPMTLSVLALNLALFASVAWLLMRLRHRIRRNWRRLPLHLLFFACLLVPIEFCRTNFLHIPDSQVVAFVRRPLIILGALVVLAGIVWQHRRVVRVAALVVGLLSPLALLTVVKIILLAFGVEHLQQHAADPTLAPLNPLRPGQPRVVWIIFDETDFRLALEQRPANVKLPEFDQLRTESVCATNACPPGDCTLVSMPGLISGHRLTGVAIKNASDLTVTLADVGATTNWSGLPTVFDAARDLGFNGAVVGWYHPYDRLLGRALSYCAWYPYSSFEPARGPTFGSTLARQIGCMAGTFYLRYRFVGMCQDALQESLSLVTNRNYNLILLHLPPPHRPGIFLPAKDRYSIFGMSKVTGYFNNLALADRFLGKLRQAMQTSGEWDRTWVVLSADHSWRESALYDGRRDLRVPFLIKAPGPGHALIYPSQINTVVTHDLLLAMLRRQLTNQQDILPWLDAHPLALPSVLDSHPD